MTEKLRQGVARLRDQSPRLNRVTDEAGRVIQAVEKFLNEECSIGIPCEVNFESDEQGHGAFEERSNLCYGRYEGKFRLFVRDVTLIHGEPDQQVLTAWASCPRDVKLKSFQHVPRLLEMICSQVDKAIAETEGATKTIDELLQVISPAKKESK